MAQSLVKNLVHLAYPADFALTGLRRQGRNPCTQGIALG